MNRLLHRILLFCIAMPGLAIPAMADCPNPAAAVVEVCNNAGGNATIRVYFFDFAGTSYHLFNLNTNTYVSEPLGPVTVDPTIPLPPGAIAGVEFAGIPNGDYVVRVNCAAPAPPPGFVLVGGVGISINSANALNADTTIDPDCDPGTGGASADGSITLDISGGSAPYDVAWPVSVTPIGSSTNLPAGNHVFSNLDGGSYTFEITDASNCVFSATVDVPLTTLPMAGGDQTVCGATANLSANAPGPGETGTWTGPAGVLFFPDANTPNAVVSNLAVGLNTLTWTITDINGICGGNSDQVEITSDAPATVDAGAPQTICAGSTVSLLAVVGGSATSVVWSTSGDGSFDNANILNAVYTPGPNDLSNGSVTLTATTDDPAGPCVAVNDNVVITINAAVSVDAGAPQTICSNGTATVSAIAGTTGSWTSSGDGLFDDPTSATAVYTPGTNDNANGTVTLTYTTTDPPGPCLPASDDVVITIDPSVNVDAGSPQTICSGGTISLLDATTNAASVAWSTSGDGSFSDATLLNPVYTPGAGDLAAGTVTLTLTTNDPAGPCDATSDDVVITIDAAATVDAGSPQTICAGSTVSIDAILGGSAASGTWSTSGGGGFDDPNSLTAIYTPSAGDIAGGSVTLTFTTNDPAGVCPAAVDNVLITIDPMPTADAGLSQTICGGSTVSLLGAITNASTVTWTTSGDGSFTDASVVNTIYTPGTNDLATGTVTLTLTTNDPPGPCVAVSDDVVITIESGAVVDAGSPQTICADATAAVTATLGGAASSGTWSTSGNGSFDDPSLASAVYTPGSNDITNGTVTLTFTSDDPAGPCPAVSDDVVITIDEVATVDAGLPQTICAGSTVTVSGTIGGAASGAAWTTSGDGSFDNATSMSAVYTPGSADLAAGVITLTLTTNDPSGPCGPASDNVVITIDEAATIDTGLPQTICVGGTASVTALIGGSATTGNWSTSGDGSFDLPASASAVYTPGAADIANGSVTLTFTTDDPAGPCDPAQDNVVITIEAPPIVDAGPPQSVCAGGQVTLAGIISGSVSAGTWSTSGDGTFDDASSLAAVYTPGANDLIAGSVTLTLNSDDPAGPCTSQNDNVVITIDTAPESEAGNPQTICSGTTTPLAGAFVSGAATTGAWSIVTQPAGGDGLLSNDLQTASPATVTFTATVAGDYTLRLTTDDPAGICGPATDEVVITVTAAPTVDAGSPQTICESGSAMLAATYSGTTGVSWSTAGDGVFNPNATVDNPEYVPGSADIASGTVTITVATLGPCPSVNDFVVITIIEDPTVDAGPPATICSSDFVVLSGSFGGSATGLQWSTSGDGSFNDTTDPDARYTPGPADSTNASVTLTATATGSCSGFVDQVVITINPAPTVYAGPDQTTCIGNSVALQATVSGPAIPVKWKTAGDGSFNNDAVLNPIYTPGANDIANGSVDLTVDTSNPPGPCPAASDAVRITFISTPGDGVTPGNETWIGYVFDDSGDAGAYPGIVDFDPSKYKGFIEAADISGMSASSAYDVDSDVFDLNLSPTDPLQGPNVCGSYLNKFSIRYRMDKSFAPGVYRFTVGADDGVMLLIDGVEVVPAGAFSIHPYTTYTSEPRCLSGVHSIEIRYFDNAGDSRLTFEYETVPALTTSGPHQLCINSAAPALTVSSPDPDVVDFKWYKNGVEVFTGASYTPSAADLDMTTAATTTFSVTAVYNCGETPGVDVDVEVMNSAILTITPQTICESGGTVDLKDFVDATPSGGAFTFTGPNVTGDNFDPTGLAGSTVSILVDYSTASCTAPQGTLDITVVNTASITVPATPVTACEASPDIDLTALVSAVPAGGTFTFTGLQVTGNNFNPSGLNGIQTILVDYTSGGCVAPQATLEIDVINSASISTNNANACETGSPLNLLTLVSPTPPGGTFMFSGPGVAGNMFNPSGQSGVVNINVDYDFNGCADNGSIQVTVLAPTDPLCVGGNCASVVIVPKVEPATCTNSDGRMIMSIKPWTPAINNTGVTITINGISSTGLNITRTNINDSTFAALPVGNYNYSIEYGDPSCVKTGIFSIDQSGTVGTPVVSNIVGPACFGTATGSVILDVPGETGNILEWSLDGGLTDPFKPFTAGSLVSGIPAGPAPSFQQVISVRRNISDVCYSSVTFTVAEAVASISATFNITPATCNGNDGAITGITPSGGDSGPYTFSIDGGQSFQAGNTFNGLAGGNYTVRVRDNSGCENDFPATVTFPGLINSTISKTNANCTNGGSITVQVTDPGSYQVALSTDQFNTPADSEYLPYTNPSVTFGQLDKGQYFVYIKSSSTVCPTRSAPINLLGAYDITFDLEPHCNNNEVSLALHNVTGDTASGAPALEIRVSRKLSSDPPYITYLQFPADGEVYLDHDAHPFLQTPGEYTIILYQFQQQVVCPMPSDPVDFTVPSQLSANIGSVSKSYPDVPSGELLVTQFTGGAHPFEVRIELDSAASFALPFFSTQYEEAGVNGNQQVVMAYDDIPAGRYIVEVRDSIGCVVDLIARVPLDVDLYIPNVFTPNGDGSNDVFFIRNLPQESGENQLTISNRWGKEVFVSENYQNNWDGAEAADGIYFYRLQLAGDQTLTGWVEIMRGPKP